MRHPARFSDNILPALAEHIHGYRRVLDPFAGTGRIHELEGHETWGIELEPEWATLHPRTLVGSALRLPFPDASFDAICTSPCYGNRMADHHEARDTSRRNTYRHALGRPLHADNAGQMQWGATYRTFHRAAWIEALRVLRPGGRFVLNISDHIRAGRQAEVSTWHTDFLQHLGLTWWDAQMIRTPRQRFGANGHLRVEGEWVIAFDKATQLTLDEAVA